MQWGYTCSSEEFDGRDLTRFAQAAEEAGFEFVTVSDHYHPWTTSQGHSPFAWTTVGAIAASTEHVGIGTGVTCPIIRYHPAVIAQAAAGANELSGGRFFLGVGTGEALNEHVTGCRWPAVDRRRAMLVEALSIMRALWEGDTVDHEGEWFTVENARLFTLPVQPIEVVVAAAGSEAAQMAAVHGDALWVTSPTREVVDAYREAGGTGRVVGQVSVCWHEDEGEATKIAFEQWPNAALSGQLSQDLPTWTHFEQAVSLARPEDVTSSIVVGADTDRLLETVGEYADAGVTAIHFHQVGPDQHGFLEAWSSTIRDAVRAIG